MAREKLTPADVGGALPYSNGELLIMFFFGPIGAKESNEAKMVALKLSFPLVHSTR